MTSHHGGTTQNLLPKVVKLDVGGFKFTTSRSTLLSIPGSHLEAMFSGRHSVEQTEDGSVFIDRDGRRVGEGYSKETLDQWEAEAKLRTAFANGEAKNFTKIDPFRGLIPLFPVPGKEGECLHRMPLKYEEECGNSSESKGALFLNYFCNRKIGVPATVKDLEEFETNFNKEWPNVLHRLHDVLLQEPVIIAGGSILRALTASKGIRTSDLWNNRTGDGRAPVPSDIDLFLYGCTPEEANRICHRIFETIADPAEKWAVIRSKGVINMHYYNDAFHRVETKIQVVLRIYDSPSEVLIGFDVDSCCCAYDGHNIWVCPRWLAAVRSGGNVLNPLHAWPNKPSYELRLAKYASRGFAVFIPGIDKNKIDYDKLHRSELRDLKGLARFIKVSAEMESAPLYKTREYAEDGDETAVYDPELECRFHHHQRGRSPGEVTTLRLEEELTFSADARLVKCLNLAYDDTQSNVLVPSVYRGAHPDMHNDYYWQLHALPTSPESRIQAWAEICDGGENHPKYVDRRLVDAWDTGKRSREYLNGQMDKYDLDNMYYAHAYKEEKAAK